MVVIKSSSHTGPLRMGSTPLVLTIQTKLVILKCRDCEHCVSNCSKFNSTSSLAYVQSSHVSQKLLKRLWLTMGLGLHNPHSQITKAPHRRKSSSPFGLDYWYRCMIEAHLATKQSFK